MQATPTMFFLKFEEHAQLYEELLEHQTVAMHEREAKHNRHMQELDKANQHFGMKWTK